MIYFFQRLFSLLWAVLELGIELVGRIVYLILSEFYSSETNHIFHLIVGRIVHSYIKRGAELRVLREYRRARWSTAGGDVNLLLDRYLKHNQIYGKVVLIWYAIMFGLLGSAITTLIYLLSF